MKVSTEHVKDFYCLGGLLAQTNKGIFAGWFVILLFMEVVWKALEIASEAEGLALFNTVTE